MEIKKLENEIRESNKKKLKQIKTKPKMIVIKTEEAGSGDKYIKTLTNKCNPLGISVLPYKTSISKDDDGNLGVTIDRAKGNKSKNQTIKGDGLIVLRPDKTTEDNLLSYDVVKNHSYFQDIDIEPLGTQIPTIKAITRIIESIGENQNVLLIGRSENLGKPLANYLLTRNHTVAISHSKSKAFKASKAPEDVLGVIHWDIVVNMGNGELIDNVDGNYLIDVSGNIDDEELDLDKVIRNIGGLTSEYAINELLNKMIKEDEKND